MAKTNPGLSLKYLSGFFCILAILCATLYRRFDTFLLGAGVGLLAYGYKLDMTTVVFISSLAIFLGSYLPFGRTSYSLVQRLDEGFSSSQDLKEAEAIVFSEKDNKDLEAFLKDLDAKGVLSDKIVSEKDDWVYNRKMKILEEKRAEIIANDEKALIKQKKYIESDDPTVPQFCTDSQTNLQLGRPSADNLFRLYSAAECMKIASAAVNSGESGVPSGIQKDGKCLWIQPDGRGGVQLDRVRGPSFDCARINFPTAPPTLLNLAKGTQLNLVNSGFDKSSEDQAYYYSKNNQWHQGKKLKLPKDDDKPVAEGFENQKEEPKKKHLPPPDNADRKEMFELGKKYELPKETDDPDYHLDAGTTFLNAYKSLKPDQLSAMSKDTMDLINTQKQLMTTLNTLKPLISDGKQMMDTFQNYFGGNSSGGLGDLSKMAEQFAK